MQGFPWIAWRQCEPCTWAPGNLGTESPPFANHEMELNTCQDAEARTACKARKLVRSPEAE
eukprot:14287748-Alexandrium_andersonii.AAC.1